MPEIPKELRHIKLETLEKIRRGAVRALEAATRERKDVITADAVRAEAGANANTCSAVMRLWRAGEVSFAEPFVEAAAPGSAREDEDDKAGPELARQVRAATSVEDLAKVAQEVTALVADERISIELSRALKDMIQEARIGRLTWAREPGAQVETDDERRMIMASVEAVQLARALDYMVDDARRTRVQEFVARELEQDMLEHPNVDQGGAAR